MSRPDHSDGSERVIVVGSGPCGAAAAARLLDRGVAVTLLDAAVSFPKGLIVRAAGNTVYRKMDQRQLESHRHDEATSSGVDWYSSRSHGGLSNYWTAAVPRFAPEDFTEGAALDERYRWPITFDELVPYYEIAERYLCVTAGSPLPNLPANTADFHVDLPDDWAAVAHRSTLRGHPMGPIPMAKGTPWMIARRGTEFSSYSSIIEPLLDSPLLELVAGAMVTELTWNSTTGRVDSLVSVDRSTGQSSTRRCRAVVLAAGAIDSTALLLRSVSPDFPDGLGNSAGVVGRYLHDHPRE